MRYNILTLAIFPLLILNCQPIKSLKEINDNDKLLSYERTPCFGYCQTYEVTVLKDGQAYFVGKNYVPFLDTAQFTLPIKTFTQLKAILQHPDYLNLTIEEPDYQIMDIPGLNFHDFEHGRIYELDMVIPEAIQVLTEKIDGVLEGQKLIYQKDSYPMIQREILVELKPGTDPYSLDGNDSFYQLSYRDSIGAGIYKFVLFCPVDRVDEALKVVKHRKGVLETQLNHTLERR